MKFHKSGRSDLNLYQLFAIIFDIILIFCATFSGDFLIANTMPAFFIFWFLVFWRKQFKVQRIELYTQIVLIVIFLPTFLFFNKYSYIYYISSLFPCLYVNVIFFTIKVFDRSLDPSTSLPSIIEWLPSIVLLSLSLFGLVGDSEEVRNSFVFGPNIFYRIVGILFLLQLLILQGRYFQSRISLIKRLLVLLLSLISLLLALRLLERTGSRGATVVMIPVTLFYITSILRAKGSKFKVFLFVFLLPICLVISVQYFSFIKSIFLDFTSGRSFTFRDDGNSSAIATRYEFINHFSDFWRNDNFLLGEGSDYKYSYPHNLYLDVLYNTGIVPFITLALFTVLLVFVLTRYRLSFGWKALMVLALPIYLGSLFSGTMHDNYPVISLILAFPMYFMLSKAHTVQASSANQLAS